MKSKDLKPIGTYSCGGGGDRAGAGLMGNHCSLNRRGVTSVQLCSSNTGSTFIGVPNKLVSVPLALSDNRRRAQGRFRGTCGALTGAL